MNKRRIVREWMVSSLGESECVCLCGLDGTVRRLRLSLAFAWRRLNKILRLSSGLQKAICSCSIREWCQGISLLPLVRKYTSLIGHATDDPVAYYPR